LAEKGWGGGVTFTDDDLKRYKNHDYSLPQQASWNDAIDALLARLEAAEHFINTNFMTTEWKDQPCYKAWRKACGK
jgi:hypothetical protein